MEYEFLCCGFVGSIRSIAGHETGTVLGCKCSMWYLNFNTKYMSHIVFSVFKKVSLFAYLKGRAIEGEIQKEKEVPSTG